MQSETATYPAAQAACAQYGTDGLLAAPVTSEIQVKFAAEHQSSFLSNVYISYFVQGVLDGLNAAGTPADFWIGLDDT